MDEKLIDEWIKELEKTGRKDTTIKRYGWTVRKMLRILEDHGRPTDPEKITRDDVLFLNDFYEAKEHVIKMNLSTLSRFIKYHTGRSVVKETNILYNSPQYTRIWIEPSDYWKLYEAADPTTRMILTLGAFMGLRSSEIVSIKDEDIDGDMMTVRGKGHGKNGKVVDMHIPEIVKDEIGRYRSWKAKLDNSGDGYLIQTAPKSRAYRLEGIRTVTLARRFMELSEITGIHVTCHSLRRLFATTLYFDVGCDEMTLKTLMRHEQVATTFQCYIHPREEKAAESMDKLNAFMMMAKT